jgi:hypothetical protein
MTSTVMAASPMIIKSDSDNVSIIFNAPDTFFTAGKAHEGKVY